jgi:formylglycine-generating enzyme required for sulfatase activity
MITFLIVNFLRTAEVLLRSVRSVPTRALHFGNRQFAVQIQRLIRTDRRNMQDSSYPTERICRGNPGGSAQTRRLGFVFPQGSIQWQIEDDRCMKSLKLPGFEIELVRIEPGEFLMGSANVVFDESPGHRVCIGQPFYLGKTPVTQGQWKSLLGSNPSHFQVSDNHPVENVSWEDSVQFCETVSVRTGYRVRLPSESQWEYACRAGAPSEFFFSNGGPFSDDAAIPASVRQELREFAWFEDNSRQKTSPVGMKAANPWGLHDVIGNVWEWCQDFWHAGYVGAPKTEEPWIHPIPVRPLRCLRGGAWNMDAFRCRSCYRSWDWERVSTNRIGFRVCVETI